MFIIISSLGNCRQIAVSASSCASPGCRRCCFCWKRHRRATSRRAQGGERCSARGRHYASREQPLPRKPESFLRRLRRRRRRPRSERPSSLPHQRRPGSSRSWRRACHRSTRPLAPTSTRCSTPPRRARQMIRGHTAREAAVARDTPPALRLLVNSSDDEAVGRVPRAINAHATLTGLRGRTLLIESQMQHSALIRQRAAVSALHSSHISTNVGRCQICHVRRRRYC